MVISSRTPEGLPGRCPLCGSELTIGPTGDAPCPSCGHLLWGWTRLAALFVDRLAKLLEIDPDHITPEAKLDALQVESLDLVEVLMKLEDEFGLRLPDEVVPPWKTVGDVIRWIEGQ